MNIQYVQRRKKEEKRRIMEDRLLYQTIYNKNVYPCADLKGDGGPDPIHPWTILTYQIHIVNLLKCSSRTSTGLQIPKTHCFERIQDPCMVYL